jgi:hypothetical protein
MMKAVLVSAACLVWVLCLSQAAAQQILYREEEPRTKRVAEEAMLAFLSGLAATAYPSFRESAGLAALTLMQIYPGLFSIQDTPQILYAPPDLYKAIFRPWGFCINFTAIAVYDLWVFPMSSFVSLTMCGACDISVKFRAKGIDSSMQANLTATQFFLENPLMRLLGLDKTIRQHLHESSKWAQYLQTMIDLTWKNTSAALYSGIYNAFQIDINYIFGSTSLLLPYLVAAVSKRGVNVHFGGHGVGDVADVGSDGQVAHIHEMDMGVLKELYQQAMELEWDLAIDSTTIPSNLSVKMNTKTFGQVIPDMLLEDLEQNLTAVVYPNKSTIYAKIAKEFDEVNVHNFTFTVIVNDWEKKILLAGNFRIDLRLKMAFRCTPFSCKLVPIIVQTAVEVLTLTSPRYQTLIKTGLGRIIQKLINEYYLSFVKDRTLDTGILFTLYPEIPDPATSYSTLKNTTVQVTVTYPNH